jgi:hypothetical protein
MIIKHVDINRFDIVKEIKQNNIIGMELGVAEGNFSYKMMESKKFKFFYGVDSYDDFQHDDTEYKNTKNKLSKFSNYQLIRKTFELALDEFEDNSLDFIYIDGFAHTGNNGGKTLFQWIDKLKIGGICAGDDYHDDWPLVKKTVQYFTKKLNIKLYITNNSAEGKYSEYPSWFFFKSNNKIINLPLAFSDEAKKKHNEELFKISFIGKILNFKSKYYIYKIICFLLPQKLFNILLNFYKGKK